MPIPSLVSNRSVDRGDLSAHFLINCDTNHGIKTFFVPHYYHQRHEDLPQHGEEDP